ncbi:MAG: hypothetical protein ACK6D5_16730 [Planctomyces sp.]
MQIHEPTLLLPSRGHQVIQLSLLQLGNGTPNLPFKLNPAIGFAKDDLETSGNSVLGVIKAKSAEFLIFQGCNGLSKFAGSIADRRKWVTEFMSDSQKLLPDLLLPS